MFIISEPNFPIIPADFFADTIIPLVPTAVFVTLDFSTKAPAELSFLTSIFPLLVTIDSVLAWILLFFAYIPTDSFDL